MTDKWIREAHRLVEDKILIILDAYPELAAQYYQYVRDLGDLRKEEQAVDEPVGDEKSLIAGLIKAVAETLRELDDVQTELRGERAELAEERVKQEEQVKRARIWSRVTFVVGVGLGAVLQILLEPVLRPILTGLGG